MFLIIVNFYHFAGHLHGVLVARSFVQPKLARPCSSCTKQGKFKKIMHELCATKKSLHESSVHTFFIARTICTRCTNMGFTKQILHETPCNNTYFARRVRAQVFLGYFLHGQFARNARNMSAHCTKPVQTHSVCNLSFKLKYTYDHHTYNI